MMDEEETKICDNCKREIPLSNHIIHSVHCERNLRLCPVCKEPVPTSQLADHHDTLHKPLPCTQCGESVCGTDLEDHVRDSCGHTVKTCRYCELELPRRDIPSHESYCGTRTEQCADCREWVMLKYRPLHLQSNHGFLRLDDDPIPQPPQPVPAKATNIPKPSSSRADNIAAPIQNGRTASGSEGPKTDIRNDPNGSTSEQGVKNVNELANMPKNTNNPSSSNSNQGVKNINQTPRNVNLPTNESRNTNVPTNDSRNTNVPPNASRNINLTTRTAMNINLSTNVAINIKRPTNAPRNVNLPTNASRNISPPPNASRNINLPTNASRNVNLPSNASRSIVPENSSRVSVQINPINSNPILDNQKFLDNALITPKLDNMAKSIIAKNGPKTQNISNPGSSSSIKSENRPSSSNAPAQRVRSKESRPSKMPSDQNGDSKLSKEINSASAKVFDEYCANRKRADNEGETRKRSSAGAVKKRPAPPPPSPPHRNPIAREPIVRDPIVQDPIVREPNPSPVRGPMPSPARDPIRETALCAALDRYYREEARREQINQYNRAHGLPPVLSAAAKLEKLRKMDALHNREVADDGAWKNKLQGRVWMDLQIPCGNVLGSEPSSSRSGDLHVDRRRPHRSNGTSFHVPDDSRRNEFKDLKPMSSSEFEKRFHMMQLDVAGGGDNSGASGSNDRFREIKSSLHALRRGLNEVTAPYVGNPNNPPPSPVPPLDNGNLPPPSPPGAAAGPADDNFLPPGAGAVGIFLPPGAGVDDDDVELPCEFCGLPQPAQDLVQHQTGCRPDLVQRVVRRDPPHSPSPPPSDGDGEVDEDVEMEMEGEVPPNTPLIPCEFCDTLLPVYLISSHQVQCRRHYHNRNQNRNDNDSDTDWDSD